jgi:hypothetical protein
MYVSSKMLLVAEAFSLIQASTNLADHRDHANLLGQSSSFFVV